MIKIVSPGEITVGMWLICYEADQLERGYNAEGEVIYKKVPMFTPFFKGIPWLCAGIAGPIIAVKSFGFQDYPPIVFLDTRLARFMEVEEEFGINYVKEMRQANSKPVPPLYISATNLNSTYKP